LVFHWLNLWTKSNTIQELVIKQQHYVKAYGNKNRDKLNVKTQGNNQTGVLYYRVGKNEEETNILQWFRSQKD
jgi:hypothetical protein